MTHPVQAHEAVLQFAVVFRVKGIEADAPDWREEEALLTTVLGREFLCDEHSDARQRHGVRLAEEVFYMSAQIFHDGKGTTKKCIKRSLGDKKVALLISLKMPFKGVFLTN